MQSGRGRGAPKAGSGKRPWAGRGAARGKDDANPQPGDIPTPRPDPYVQDRGNALTA